MGQILSTAMFRALKRRVDWGHVRVGILNENLANSNTPNYHARDLSPSTARQGGALPPLPPLTTHAAHLHSPTASKQRIYKPVKDVKATRPDGHLNINEQLVKLQETHSENALLLEASKKFISMYKLSLGR